MDNKSSVVCKNDKKEPEMVNEPAVGCKNNEAASPDKSPVATNSNGQQLNEKYMDQFSALSVGASMNVFNTLRENISDYKAIDEDKNLSTIDKAVGKRKLLCWDTIIGSVSLGGFLGVVWLVKKVFPI